MELQIPQAAVDRFRGAMPDILAVFRDLGLDQVDIGGYGSVVAAQRHQRAFDKYLAEPFLEAMARGAAECFEANRVQIEALDSHQQRYYRRELRRRWLVVVMKYTPSQLQSFVRQAEFEKAMDLRVLRVLAASRDSAVASPAPAGEPTDTEQSSETESLQEIPTGSADPVPAPSSIEETERLVRDALLKDDQPAVKAALAELWGSAWNIRTCAGEAHVDRGTVRHMIRGENIRPQKWRQIVDAFHERRLRLRPTN
jgi:hypothetical protein